MAETVEVVHIITPGKTVMLALNGARVNVKGKTIVRPNHYTGVDEAEMARMVQEGLLQKVPITSLPDLPNVDLRNRTPTLETGTAENPIDINDIGGPAPTLSCNLDPEELRGRVAAGHLSLEQLNLMVRERDQNVSPFNEPVAAINWLSSASDRRPAMESPPPAPADSPPPAPPAS